MSAEPQNTFSEEEELRIWLEEQAHTHDCEESGCTLNPKGEAIPDGEKALKPSPPDWVKEKLLKFRGIKI